MDEIHERAYQLIDDTLKELYSEEHGGSIWLIDDGAAGILAEQLMENHELFFYRNPHDKRRSLVDISPKGREVLNNGGFKIYLDKLNEVQLKQQEMSAYEFEKLKTEIELLRHQLKDYPRVKKQNNALFIITILSALAAIASAYYTYIQTIK